MRVQKKKELIYDKELRCYKVPLSKGEFALIDLFDHAKISQYNWHIQDGNYGYKYAITIIDKKQYFLQKMVMAIERNDEKQIVKFHNNNSLDCRRKNLFLTTRSEHMKQVQKFA